MAGLWHLSHHQLHDLNGRPIVGARAAFLASSTTSPITVYQDSSLGTAHPNPVVSNGRGIFPPVFLDEADGFYRQRIYTPSGVLIEGTDIGIIPIIGPSEGDGGAEVPVDPNSLMQTGDFDWQPRSGARSGWVRANGRTIGSASSGASERANADCEALYLFNWNEYSDTYCPVTGGRGVSAAADWAANKAIGMPNLRNRVPAGLPDMGNTDSGEFDAQTFSVGNKTTAMSMGGDANLTIVTANLPPYTPAGSVLTSLNLGNAAGLGGANSSPAPGNTTYVVYAGGVSGASASSTFTGSAQGGTSTPMDKMPPFVLGTWYQRL